MSGHVIEVTREDLEQQRAKLVSQIRGKSEDRLRQRADEGRLSVKESDILEAIEDIDFLLAV